MKADVLVIAPILPVCYRWRWDYGPEAQSTSLTCMPGVLPREVVLGSEFHPHAGRAGFQ